MYYHRYFLYKKKECIMYKRILLSIIVATCALMAFFSCSQAPQSSGYDMVPLEKSCLFVSTVADTGDPQDVPLINKLRSWGCEVRVVAETELTAMADSFTQYDFAFLSETPNSSNFKPFKGHPLPLLNLEAYACAKADVLNWSTFPSAVAKYDPLPLRIADGANVELTGGLASGSELQLVTGTISSGEAEIGFIPTIQHISIARIICDTLVNNMVAMMGVDSSAIESSGGLLTTACAVEKGMVLADGVSTTQYRAVTIGIHAYAFEYITDEAYAMIHAGIVWILK